MICSRRARSSGEIRIKVATKKEVRVEGFKVVKGRVVAR
jgi:hypothetical protein